jgi:hypothetical protein
LRVNKKLIKTKTKQKQKQKQNQNQNQNKTKTKTKQNKTDQRHLNFFADLEEKEKNEKNDSLLW